LDSMGTGLAMPTTSVIRFRSVAFLGFTVTSRRGCDASSQSLHADCAAAFAGARAAKKAEVVGPSMYNAPSRSSSNGRVLFACASESDCKEGANRFCIDIGAAWPLSSSPSQFTQCCSWGEYVPCVADLGNYDVSTMVGTGTSGHQHGDAGATKLTSPRGLAVFANGSTTFFADDHSVRGITVNTQTTWLVAGTGVPGFNDAVGSAAGFNTPVGLLLAASQTILYVADSLNHKIRSVDILTAQVTSLSGTGEAGFQDGLGNVAQFHTPLGIQRSDNVMFVADSGNHRIRSVSLNDGSASTLAGNGISGGADGVGESATFDTPRSLAITQVGDQMFVATGQCTIRQISISTRLVTTIVGSPSDCQSVDGTGSSARLQPPSALTLSVDEMLLYIAESDGHRVRGFGLQEAKLFTMAGNGVPGAQDSHGTSATFSHPLDLATSPDGTTLFVADSGYHKIRRLQLSPLDCPPTKLDYSLSYGILLT